MSEDEIIAAVVCAFVTLATWLRWGFVAASIPRFNRVRSAAGFSPWLGVLFTPLLVHGILARFAAHDVRDSAPYLGFYLLLGAAMIGVAVGFLDRLGLSLRDDVLERRNPAACLAWTGAVVGLGLAYAGANIGDGPGWWVVVFSGALALGSLLLGWVLLDRVGACGEAILVERDEAAGLRVGAWFVATGAIAGRAAAGDWVGYPHTVADFARAASGALVLAMLASVYESWANHRPPADEAARTRLLRGAAPALLWLGLAAAYLVRLGSWQAPLER